LRALGSSELELLMRADVDAHVREIDAFLRRERGEQ
jgi:hypothetical protein